MPILWLVAIIIFFGWVLGFSFHVGGDLIHLLLVVLIIVVIWNLIIGSRNNRSGLL
jgi:hypothetical protein